MKLFSKIATAFVGIAMAVGVGVAVNAGYNANSVTAETALAATFSCGDDGAASHADGSSATTYEETNGDYTLSITDGVKFYTGARDAKGNGCFKFGTSSAIGSIKFTVPSDVLLVKIYVAGYKNNSAKVSINSGSAQTISTLSNNGEYTAVDVNTSSSKAVTFATASGGVRCMINTIEFYVNGGDPEKQDSTVEITTSKPLNLNLVDDPVQLAVTTTPADLSLTYTSSDESVVTVSNSGLVTPQGTGTATITVAFAGNDDYNPSSDTISVSVTRSEPAHVTGKTISEIVSETTSADPLLIYEVEGYVTSWYGSNTDGTQYGNFYVADTAGDTSHHAYVYGANYANGAVWNGMKYTFSNNKTFLTNEVTSQITIGSKITAEFIAFVYNGTTFEFQGEIKTVVNPSKELTSIDLDLTNVTTSFELNDTFNYDGLVVTAHYGDGSTKEVTPTSVSSPDMTSVGDKTVTVSYTENEITKTASYTISVVEQIVYWTITFDPGTGSGVMDPVQVKDNDEYVLPECTFTPPEGKVFAGWTIDGSAIITVIEHVTAHTGIVATWKDAPSTVSDTITRTDTGVSGTTYSSWTLSNTTSGALYAGNSAGPTTGTTADSIQLRSSTSSGSSIHSGIVATSTGGTLVSVSVVWNSGCTAGRVIDVYGKNSAYSSADDLYNSSTCGTKIGSITQGESTEVLASDSYEYVGIRSNNGALNIDSVTFVWEAGSEAPLTGISVSGAKTDFKVGEEFVTTGLIVTGHYQDAPDRTITTGYEVDSSSVDTTAAGDYTVVVSYGGFDDSYTVTYTQPVIGTYKKVETNLADFTGDYLIVFEDESSLAMDGSLTSFGANDYVGVSIANNVIQAPEEHEFHVNAKEGGYSIQSASGKYIGKTADSNGVDTSDTDQYVNSIQYVGDETSNMDIIAESNGHLRCNGSDQRFVFYKASTYTAQKAVSLYIQVEDDAEALTLDILNKTSAACAAEGEHAKSDFESAWSELKTAYNAITDASAKARLSSTAGDADGTMFYEGLARYDILVRKYGLENFISDRDVQGLGTVTSISNNTVNTNFAMIAVIVVAVTSLSAIGVLLVVKKRKYHN